MLEQLLVGYLLSEFVSGAGMVTGGASEFALEVGYPVGVRPLGLEEGDHSAAILVEPYLWGATSFGEGPVAVVALEVTWFVGFEEGPVTEQVLSEIVYQFAMEKVVATEFAEAGGGLVRVGAAGFDTASYVARELVES